MNTGNKIVRGFGLALAILIVITLVSGLNSFNLQKTAASVTHTRQVRSSLRTVLAFLQDAETGQRGFLLTGDEKYLEPYNNAKDEIDGAITELSTLTADNTNQQQRIKDQLKPNVQSKLAELAKTIQLKKDDKSDEALALVVTDEGKTSMDAIRSVIDEMTTEEDGLLAKRQASASFWTIVTYVFLILGTIAAAVVLAIIAGRISHDVTQSLEEASLATVQVGSASREIAAASQQQVSSLTESAAAINQISVTSEEFKSTIQEFGDRAQAVQEAAAETAEQAIAGRAQAQQAAEQTEATRDSARAVGETVLQFANQMQRITDITDTVNEIAEQTKLLALNASIEAARAGEQGKGFAVVATQVRELANQSKDAARNISTLISNTRKSLQSVVSRIEQGSRQSDETATMVRTMADRFAQIVAAFGQTADAMTQIAGGAQQQGAGIVELVAGLAELDSATKETVAAAEQTQISIADIDQQINSLNATMEKL